MGQTASSETSGSAFQQLEDSIIVLLKTNVAPSNTKFWENLWRISFTPRELQNVLTPLVMRAMCDTRFINLSTMFLRATVKLNEKFGKEDTKEIPDETDMNCVRILTLILPFLKEHASKDPEVNKLFFSVKAGVTYTETEKKANPQENNVLPTGESLSTLMMRSAMKMLFIPNFTCNEPAQNSVAVDPIGNSLRKMASHKTAKNQLRKDGVSLLPTNDNMLWADPLKSQSTATDALYDKHRIDILHLLLAGLCDPLFSKANKSNSSHTGWKSAICSASVTELPSNAVNLFYSLLNELISYNPNRFISNTEKDEHLQLVEVSAKVLCVLLDGGQPGDSTPIFSTLGNPVVDDSVSKEPDFNIYRTLLARIHKEEDIKCCFEGLSGLLRTIYDIENPLFPVEKFACLQELSVVILLKLLEENPEFLNYLSLDEVDVNKVIGPVCFLMYIASIDLSKKNGLVQTCIFVLLILSCEREILVGMSEKFEYECMFADNFKFKTYADLLGVTVYKLFAAKSKKILPFYSCMLTIFCNMSPYWHPISDLTAVKLVELFEFFALPKFIYTEGNALRYLEILADTFTNIIHYQYANNEALVYAIIKQKAAFERIANLTLDEAKRECSIVNGFDSSDWDYSGQDLGAFKSAAGKDIDYEDYIAEKKGVQKFVVTKEWIDEMHEDVCLESIIKLMEHLDPIIDQLKDEGKGTAQVLKHLKGDSLVGVLPVPPEIVVHKYKPNKLSSLWSRVFMWGTIMREQQRGFIIFDQSEELPIFAV